MGEWGKEKKKGTLLRCGIKAELTHFPVAGPEGPIRNRHNRNKPGVDRTFYFLSILHLDAIPVVVLSVLSAPSSVLFYFVPFAKTDLTSFFFSSQKYSLHSFHSLTLSGTEYHKPRKRALSASKPCLPPNTQRN